VVLTCQPFFGSLRLSHASVLVSVYFNVPSASKFVMRENFQRKAVSLSGHCLSHSP
jgi:hypothetical protein